METIFSYQIGFNFYLQSPSGTEVFLILLCWLKRNLKTVIFCFLALGRGAGSLRGAQRSSAVIEYLFKNCLFSIKNKITDESANYYDTRTGVAELIFDHLYW